jgi:hypothetical protein
MNLPVTSTDVEQVRLIAVDDGRSVQLREILKHPQRAVDDPVAQIA